VSLAATPGERRPHVDPAEGYRLLERAAQYFAALLAKSSKADAARGMLAERGFSETIVARFGLGYAWGRRDDWTQLVRKKGWSVPLSMQIGLTAQSASRDRFRHRLMFPIVDARARVLGFGGRRVDPEDRAKYINSPDSRWFHKGQVLFGLQQADPAWRRRRRAVLCEGYTDVLRLHDAGVDDAVAPMGTALTPTQAARIAARVRQVVLAFDADEAGIRAALQSWALVTARGAEVRWLQLPSGEDPDSYGQTQGAAALAEAVDTAPAFWPTLLAQQVEGTNAAQRRTRVAKLLETMAEHMDVVTAELYLDDLAQAAGVRRETLLDRFDQLRRSRNRPQRGASPRRFASKSAIERPKGSEEMLARWILQHPESRLQLEASLRETEVHPWLRALLQGREQSEPAYRTWLAEQRHASLPQLDLPALIDDVHRLAAQRAHVQKIHDLEQAAEHTRREHGGGEQLAAILQTIAELRHEGSAK